VTFSSLLGIHNQTDNRHVDSITDEVLMRGVGDGEVENLGILYERHRTRLFNFFVRLTGNNRTSEDLVHDVFLRMLKYRRSFDVDNRFMTWMYKIARNAHHDCWRKRQHEVSLETAGFEQDESVSCPEPAPDLRLRESQELLLVKEALARLSFESKEVLVLSRFQNLKYEEIARILDCGVGAVKMRVHRALKELREHFRDLAGEKAI
jgi:RNA polymerase sigma factor (sigma-70 family)